MPEANNSLVQILYKNLEDILIKRENINLDLIKKAFLFAKESHKNQKRLSGEDFIIHPLKVAIMLAKMGLDSETIASALLHDVVEDTMVSLETIKREFGPTVAFFVKGVTKLNKIKYNENALETEQQVENIRNIFLAIAEDLRVALIKLADRLHNMETLEYLPEEQKRNIALETLTIYAPLALRLGIGEIKGELEDLSFKYAYPMEYAKLLKEVSSLYKDREKYLEKVIKTLKKELYNHKINFIEIHSRAKHFYSLYKKLLKYNGDLSQIYDLVAVRIIVETVEECYAVLGLIHKLWKPLPGRIKDYISLPKPNGYQSLHTTVICLDGKPTEFQIRTKKMHYEAEYGIAAHWFYSEIKNRSDVSRDKIQKVYLASGLDKLKFVQQLREWKNKDISGLEFMSLLQTDFLKNLVFVFTPRGDIINLPEGSTAIDFAFHVHTEIGNHCCGVKIDGVMAPLSRPLKNGEIVEIITSKDAKPNLNWLRFVKTNLAKSKILEYFRKQEKKKNETKSSPEERKVLLKKDKNQKINNIISKLPNLESGVVYKFAKCCKPHQAREIIGYISIKNSLTIHDKDCFNVKKMRSKERLMSISWHPNSLSLGLKISFIDRVGLLNDITKVFKKNNINIKSIVDLDIVNEVSGTILFNLELSKHTKVKKIIKKIAEIPNIIKIEKI